MSKEDPKTGCFNERFFRDMFNVELRRAERHEQTLSLMLVDIDDFKGLNDRCGHLFGDRILKKFAELLKGSARVEDMVGRYGGDEFILLLPQTGRVGARSLGERVRCRLIEHFSGRSYEGQPASVTFSAGIATYPYDAHDYEGLVRCADAALYKSKRLGKNRIYDYLDEQFARPDDGSEQDDKRRFRRFRLEEENQIRLEGPDGVVAITGKLVNISSGGALLECHCTIDEGLYNKKLAVSVERIGKRFLEGMQLPGSVVRVNSEDRRFRFHMALQFERELTLDEWAGIEQHAALVPA
jgi:diguanylate cyclase (GGDEF)-like protein